MKTAESPATEDARAGIREDEAEAAKNQAEDGEIEPERPLFEAGVALIGPNRGREWAAAGSVEADSREVGPVENGVEAATAGNEPVSRFFDTD